MIENSNIWNLLVSIYNFIILFFKNAEKLWNSKIDTGIIGSIFLSDLYFYELAGASLVVAVGALLIKKLVPDIL